MEQCTSDERPAGSNACAIYFNTMTDVMIMTMSFLGGKDMALLIISGHLTGKRSGYCACIGCL